MIVNSEFNVDRFKLGHVNKPELHIKAFEKECLCQLGARIGEQVPFRKFTISPGQERYSFKVVVVEKEIWEKKILLIKKAMHDCLSPAERNTLNLLMHDLMNT